MYIECIPAKITYCEIMIMTLLNCEWYCEINCAVQQSFAALTM
jgi:hypothetical protein